MRILLHKRDIRQLRSEMTVRNVNALHRTLVNLDLRTITPDEVLQAKVDSGETNVERNDLFLSYETHTFFASLSLSLFSLR